MTRKEIEEVYRVESDIIRDPGQFEAAHVSTPHFHEIVLNGFGDLLDDPDSQTYLVEVSAADRTEFNLTPEDRWARVRHDFQGFVDVHFVETRPTV